MPSSVSFARHYVPLLASLSSRLNSKVRWPHCLQLLGWTSRNRRGQGLALKDVKARLGPRVDGRGHLLNPASIFAQEEDDDGGTWPGIARIPRALINDGDGTQKECHRETTDLQRQTALHLQTVHNPTQTYIRSSYSPDLERGRLIHGIHVETRLESSWTHSGIPS